MRVTFKLYAMLSDYLPDEARKTNSLTLDVPPDRAAGRALAEGDVLAIWPPIAGG